MTEHEKGSGKEKKQKNTLYLGFSKTVHIYYETCTLLYIIRPAHMLWIYAIIIQCIIAKLIHISQARNHAQWVLYSILHLPFESTSCSCSVNIYLLHKERLSWQLKKMQCIIQIKWIKRPNTSEKRLSVYWVRTELSVLMSHRFICCEHHGCSEDVVSCLCCHATLQKNMQILLLQRQIQQSLFWSSHGCAAMNEEEDELELKRSSIWCQLLVMCLRCQTNFSFHAASADQAIMGTW